MNCPKCGALLEEDSKYCASCGANLSNSNADESTPVVASAQIEKEKKPLEIKDSTGKPKTIGLIVGSILIVIGLVRIFTAGTTISSTSFGADFYTYTYQGIVAISEILASIEATLGWIVVAVGAAIDINSLKH